MSLEESIEHLRDIINDPNHVWSCESCKQEHQQLLNWLLELEELRKFIREIYI
jgi:hypothetical protein